MRGPSAEFSGSVLMSHLVTFTASDGTIEYRPFDDLGSAVQFVEAQCNAGSDDAALFELRGVPLAVRSYVRVEVADNALVDSRAPATLVGVAPGGSSPGDPGVSGSTVAPAAVAFEDVPRDAAAFVSPFDPFAADHGAFEDLIFTGPGEAVPNQSPLPRRRSLFGR